MKHFKLGLFIFTRDFRLNDNIGLINALNLSENILPVFIFNPSQISDKNTYKSNRCIKFMIECLDELDSELRKKASKLFYFYGDAVDIVEKLIKNEKIEAIFMNQDYTPFARKRENELEKTCEKYEIKFHKYEDYMLTGVNKIKPYLKFTPYYLVAKNIQVNKPMHNKYTNYVSRKHIITFEYKKSIHNFYDDIDTIYPGGRSHAINILKKISKFKNYNKLRDYPGADNTTHLSPYLKFNVVSIREVYHIFKNKLGSSNQLLKQLYWRDFYMQIMYNNNVIRTSMNKKFQNIEWENDATKIKKWKEGKTGIPIIDAGMRQMNMTGWMHNRVRMIVSNFLVKILHCDWRIGEKYFAQKLIDYDPANNNGGWQWSASTGTDSQPYFRTFNPWRQTEKFDPQCTYIKKYVEELTDVDNKIILNWNDEHMKHKFYIKPIVTDIQKEFIKTIKYYKKAH